MEAIGVLVVFLVLACALGAIFFNVSDATLQTTSNGIALGNPEKLAAAQAVLDRASAEAAARDNEQELQARLAIENQKAQSILDFNAQKLQGTLAIEEQKLKGTLTIENQKLSGTATAQALASEQEIGRLNNVATSQAQIYEENLRRVHEEAIATRTKAETEATVTISGAQVGYEVGSIENKGGLENAVYGFAMTIIKLLALAVFVLYAFGFMLFFSRKWSSLNPNNKQGWK